MVPARQALRGSGGSSQRSCVRTNFVGRTCAEHAKAGVMPAADHVLRALPVAWDDTRLLDGAPDSHATLARRAGAEWWLASVHAGAAVGLAFLEPGRSYRATITADDGADGPAVSAQTVTAADTLTVPVAADGGFTVRLRP
jgi:alpha-glucosidase